jgi:Fe-S oxidoreductase
VGKSAVEVLEKMGYEVIIPNIHELGRVQLSKGMLNEAKEIAEKVIKGFAPFIKWNIPIVGLEPSEILTLRDEFLDLVEEEDFEKAKLISSRAFSFEEFVILHRHQLPEPIEEKKTVLHGHCHTKALTGNAPTKAALEAAGYEVEELDTGCCGMAGSFGYEADKYELSMEIGWQRLFPQLGNLEEGRNICAPGFSCRHQIYDGTGMHAQHPAVLIARNLSDQ